MMKRIFIPILLLLCLSSLAQEPTKGNFVGAYRYKDVLYIDSISYQPSHNSTTLVPLRDGGLRYNPESGFLQVWMLGKWQNIISGNTLLDSLGVAFNSRYQKLTLRVGQKFFAFGDSFTVGSGATVPTTKGYIYLVREQTGTTMTNYGRSGGGVVEMFHQGTTNLPDTLNTVHMTVLCGFNDAIRGGGDPREQAKINAGFRAFIANAFLKTAVAANQVTKYGTWTNVAGIGNFPIKANDIGSGGGLGVVNVIANDSLVWNFTGNNIVIGYINNDAAAAGFAIGSFEVFIDGVSKGIYSGNNKSLAVSDSHWSNIYSNNAVVITGLGVGSHRVRLVHIDAANIYIDYFGTLMAPSDCPAMLIGSIPKLDSAGYSTHLAYPPSDSTFDLCSQQIRNAIAEFVGYPIVYVDVNRWFAADGIGIDNTHPNDTGHRQLANAFIEVMEGGKTILDPWISTDNKKQIMLVGLNAHYDNNIFSRITTGKKSSSAVFNIDDTHPIAFGVAAHNDIGVAGYLMKLFHDGTMSINSQPGYDVDKTASANLQVNGSFATKTRTLTSSTIISDYALFPTDYTIVIATTATLKDTVSLPVADSNADGRIYCIKNNRPLPVKSAVSYSADSLTTLNLFPATSVTWVQCVKLNSTTFAWTKINNEASSGSSVSVGLSLPSIFSVTGSPVTTTGTLTGTLVTQAANTVFSGPTTGSAAVPIFRSLVTDDIPSLDAGKVTTGMFAPARLATGTGTSANLFRGDQVYTNELLGSLVLTTSAGSQLVIQNDVSNKYTISVGVTGTATHTLVGTSPVHSFPQQVNTTGGISTSSSTTAANFYAPGLGTAASTTVISRVFGGAANVAFKTVMGGTTAYSMIANQSATNLLVGGTPFTGAATGTHYVIAGAVIRQQAITPGAAPITNTANLYLNAPSRSGANNYVLLADTGNVRVNDTAYLRTIMALSGGVPAELRLQSLAGSYANPALTRIGGVGGDATILGANAIDSARTNFISSGSNAFAITTIINSTLLDNTHFTVLGNNSSDIVVTLPTASSCTGRVYHVKKISNNGNTITINAATGVLIDGAATSVISTLNQSLTLQSNGTSWYIL